MQAFRPGDGERPAFCAKNSGAGFLASCGRFAAVALLSLVGGFAEAAGDFEKGVELYFAGDSERAREILLPLADAGDAKAQFYAGILTRGEERWRHMETAAEQCLPEAIEFVLHNDIVRKDAKRLEKTAHYAECVRRDADYPAARYVLAQLEAHAPDGAVGEGSSVAALLDEEVENLTFREALLVGLMVFALGERGDARPYFARAAGMGDYESVRMLSAFSRAEEDKQFWGGVADWFERAMEDGAEIAGDDAVAEYVRANYLSAASGFRGLYDRCREMRKDIPERPYLWNCVAQALNADYQSRNFALREHWDKYRASKRQQDIFAISTAGAPRGGGAGFSWRALERVRLLVESRLLALP